MAGMVTRCSTARPSTPVPSSGLTPRSSTRIRWDRPRSACPWATY